MNPSDFVAGLTEEKGTPRKVRKWQLGRNWTWEELESKRGGKVEERIRDKKERGNRQPPNFRTWIRP